MTPFVDFFVHIPKTAGTTISCIMEEQYPPEALLSLHPLPPGEDEVRQRLGSIGPEVRCLRAHLHAGWATALPRPCRLFTILRSPVDRILSLYFFAARDRENPAHQAIRGGELTLEQLAKIHANVQARMVAGVSGGELIDDAVLLGRAKSSLARFAAFGLTERFDETILFFNRALDWHVRGYVRANVTADRPRKEEIPQATIQAIRDCTVVDQALYDFACDLFARRVADQPADFAAELGALRARVAGMNEQAKSPHMLIHQLELARDNARNLKAELKAARSELKALREFKRSVIEDCRVPGGGQPALRRSLALARFFRKCARHVGWR